MSLCGARNEGLRTLGVNPMFCLVARMIKHYECALYGY